MTRRAKPSPAARPSARPARRRCRTSFGASAGVRGIPAAIQRAERLVERAADLEPPARRRAGTWAVALRSRRLSLGDAGEDAPAAGLAGDRGVVEVGVEAQERELEAVLAPRLAVAGPGVAPARVRIGSMSRSNVTGWDSPAPCTAGTASKPDADAIRTDSRICIQASFPSLRPRVSDEDYQIRSENPTTIQQSARTVARADERASDSAGRPRRTSRTEVVGSLMTRIGKRIFMRMDRSPIGALAALLLLTYQAAEGQGPAPARNGSGSSVTLAVTRDTWFSNVGTEADGNNGGAPRLKLKSNQEMSLDRRRPRAAQGPGRPSADAPPPARRASRGCCASRSAASGPSGSRGRRPATSPQAGSSTSQPPSHPDVPWTVRRRATSAA